MWSLLLLLPPLPVALQNVAGYEEEYTLLI